MKIRISFTINEENKEHLDKLCSAIGFSRSHYIRALIEKEYFNLLAKSKLKKRK